MARKSSLNLSTRIARLQRRMLSESQLSLRSLTDDELAAMLLNFSQERAPDDNLPNEEHGRAQVRS